MALTQERVCFAELRSLSSGSVTGSYQVVGSTFANNIILLKVVNDSDQDITVSYDGSTDQDFIPANTYTLYDLNTNSYLPSRGGGALEFAIGTGVYVKGSAGTGNIYVVAVFAG